MFFFLAGLIVAIACSIITIRTLVGYTDLNIVYKVLVSLVIISGWFAFMIVSIIRKNDLLSPELYTIVSGILYGLMGFVFILFMFLVMRDIVWYAIYGITKLLKNDGWHIDPRNISLLNYANLIVLGISLLASIFALYQGCKLPNIVNEVIYSNKINRNLRIVQISDFHITRATPVSRVIQIVNQVNNLGPEVVVITGDIIDDKIPQIKEQLEALRELSAPFGVFVVMGNHEFYNDVYASKRIFESLGMKFLFNGGYYVGNTNIFVAGIPDLNTMFERVNFWRTIGNSQKSDYKVLLSHNPAILDSLSQGIVDLVLSGHTHGGQIFPFHWLVKQANNYLAGKYRVKEIDMLVSRGVGTWGPMMRLFAPSDIIVIDLLKK